MRSGNSVATAGALLAMAWALPCHAQAGNQVANPRNLEGVWQLEKPATRLEPVDGPIPFTAVGARHYRQNQLLQRQRKYDDYDITLSRCSSPGTPRLMLTPYRFKIWQRQGVVTFDYEWNRAIRQINMTGQEPEKDWFGSDLAPTMTGTTTGHWEGDTIVAESINFSERTLLDDLVPHGFDLKVTEHLRLIDADTLEDRITIADPEYFTRPWSAVLRYKRQPDARFAEDVCLDRIKAGQPAFPGRSAGR